MKMILRFEMLKIFLFGGVDKEITQSFLNSSGYDGNIYILQGHHTYSAASDLCYLLKALYPNAILVGDKNGQSIPMVGQRENYLIVKYLSISELKKVNIRTILTWRMVFYYLIYLSGFPARIPCIMMN